MTNVQLQVPVIIKSVGSAEFRLNSKTAMGVRLPNGRCMLNHAARKAVKVGFGADTGLPLILHVATVEPYTSTEGYHYETKAGVVIKHPSAYSKKGWSDMIYVGSDRGLHIDYATVLGLFDDAEVPSV